eukprot:10735328-Alexandrium_andersonii.AAC.1
MRQHGPRPDPKRVDPGQKSPLRPSEALESAPASQSIPAGEAREGRATPICLDAAHMKYSKQEGLSLWMGWEATQNGCTPRPWTHHCSSIQSPSLKREASRRLSGPCAV